MACLIPVDSIRPGDTLRVKGDLRTVLALESPVTGGGLRIHVFPCSDDVEVVDVWTTDRLPLVSRRDWRSGDYIFAEDRSEETGWAPAIVREVSPDGRLVMVELEGDDNLWRYSPDELRYR